MQSTEQPEQTASLGVKLAGRLVTPKGVQAGEVRLGERLEEVRYTNTRPTGPYILPGFIDTHVHGGGGGDTMDGAEGVCTLARFHLERGATTLYPTTMTSPWTNILAALRGVQEVAKQDDKTLPSIPGAHLEGPFISPERLGAQPAYTLAPTAEHIQEVLGLGVVKLVTLAPEIPGAIQAAKHFAQADVRVSVGHTTASFEQTRDLVRAVQEVGGVVGFTHLYNAMSALESRAPGAVGAAFAEADAYAELIFDTHHVHPGSFLAALSAKPDHLHLITDAIRACGLREGQTELGGQTVNVSEGAARLEDGTLAGSVLTLDQALRNACNAGVPLEQVSNLLSDVPARYLGLTDRGKLGVGKRADLVLLDDELQILEVYVAGRKMVG